MSSKPLRVESKSLEELEELFEKHTFAIPYIQRDFVWTKKKIINLLDSIKKQYPIGSFLICKIPSSSTRHIRESNNLPRFDEKSNKECYIIIDGQQRLTVLYSVISGRAINSNRYSDPIDTTSICLSKRQGESEFEFYDMSKGNYIKLCDVLNGRIDKRNGGRRVAECIDAFKGYSFPFIFITGYDKKRMEEAFIRLNTGGTTLEQFDRYFAESYHRDTDLRGHCYDLINHELKNGFQHISPVHIFKAIAANLGEEDFVSSKLHTFAKRLSNPKDEYHKQYKQKHKKIFQSINRASDFLIKRFGHASYIPYDAMLTILSIFYYNNDNHSADGDQTKEIEKWFWITGFTRRYSGSNWKDNLINDAKEMKELAKQEAYKMNLGRKHKIEKISLDRLSRIKYNQRGAEKDTLFCYLISKKPREFNNGDEISVNTEMSSIFNSKNDHHIFSKKILQDEYYYLDEINKIFNICFLTFGENNIAKDRPPWVYLREYKKKRYFKKVLASHVMPYDKCLLEKGPIREKYEVFLKKRKEMIKKDLIRLIGEKYVSD